MADINDVAPVDTAIEFLQQARDIYQSSGYEVQTIRIATQPLTDYAQDWHTSKTIAGLAKLDRLAVANNLNVSIGPIAIQNQEGDRFADWASELIANTRNINFSIAVASFRSGVEPSLAKSAALAIKAIAGASPLGEGNFRFAATAFCPPGTPFFPAAYHQGPAAFSIGFESPRLLQRVFAQAGSDRAMGRKKLKLEMEQAFLPIQKQAVEIAERFSRRYLGIDVSPAPAPDSSIGQAIENLTGVPFGGASTLAACALITDVLKSLDLKQCGYSGLMLPVLEDRVLAQRAEEGRYGVSELLLYSSVCGTGLDVVPLPGDVSVESLTAVVLDMASLANKYRKPLSARLLPIPGRAQGERVKFNNPYLVDSVVMNI